MKLALFDLDHTLLNTDSDHSWGEFLVNEGLVDPVRHRQMNDKFYDDYKDFMCNLKSVDDITEFVSTYNLFDLWLD